MFEGFKLVQNPVYFGLATFLIVTLLFHYTALVAILFISVSAASIVGPPSAYFMDSTQALSDVWECI